MDNVRTHIGKLHREIAVIARCKARFHCCGVAGARCALSRVHALPKARVWCDRDWRYGWAAGKRERFINAVLRLLLHILNEGKLRRGEWRRDAGLIDEDNAKAGTRQRFSA